MSTKLFNGHEIVGHSLETFLPQLTALRQALQPLAQQRSVAAVTRMAVYAHDRHVLGLGPAKSMSFLTDAEFALHERQRSVRTTQRRDPLVDFEFSVCLFPVEGRLLALAYAEQKDFLALWKAQPWRRDFAYWNNTDEPDDVPAQEWAERERLWNLVFDETAGTPAECGYSFTLLPMEGNFLFATSAEVEQHLPDLDTRVKEVLPLYLDLLRTRNGQEPAKGYRETMALLESAEADEARKTVSEQLGEHPLTARLLRGGNFPSDI